MIFKREIFSLFSICLVILGVGFFAAVALAQEPVSGNAMEILKTVGLPQAGDLNFAKIAAYIIFGAVGLSAFIYGKKNRFWKPMAIGITLMAYPYFASSTLALYLIGAALTAALFLWWD